MNLKAVNWDCDRETAEASAAIQQELTDEARTKGFDSFQDYMDYLDRIQDAARSVS